MKDAPLLRGNLAVRLVALFVGLSLFGLAIVFMLESRLGLPPWDVLHLGIAKHTPMSLGTTVIVVGSIIVAITWIAGTPPGFGTIANTIVIGVAIDVLSSFDAIQRLSDSAMPVRIALLAAGVSLFGVGSALYIGAGMGAGPRDSLMLLLSRRTGQRIGLVRGTLEITVLMIGVLLGGRSRLRHAHARTSRRPRRRTLLLDRAEARAGHAPTDAGLGLRPARRRLTPRRVSRRWIHPGRRTGRGRLLVP